MEQIIQEAEKILDKVLNFYKKSETHLSYRPKIQYIDAPCSANPWSLTISTRMPAFYAPIAISRRAAKSMSSALRSVRTLNATG